MTRRPLAALLPPVFLSYHFPLPRGRQAAIRIRGQPKDFRVAIGRKAASCLSSAALHRKGPAMSLFASAADAAYALVRPLVHASDGEADRKSTRLNSSH